MIISKKQAKKLGLNPTIDLREQYAKQYLENKKTSFQKNKEVFLKILAGCGVIWYIIFAIMNWSGFVQIGNVEAKTNLTMQEKIRIDRLKSCEKYAHINEIYGQDAVVRCATFMTLVFAYESNFGKSNMCQNKKNCFGIKGNGIEYPAGFVTFSSYTEARRYFAKKYFQFHYKKRIKTFIYNWSMTDRGSYILFFTKNFWKTYNEILKLK